MLKFIHDSAIQWLSLGLSSGLESITSQLQREKENRQKNELNCGWFIQHSLLQQIFTEHPRLVVLSGKALWIQRYTSQTSAWQNSNARRRYRLNNELHDCPVTMRDNLRERVEVFGHFLSRSHFKLNFGLAGVYHKDSETSRKNNVQHTQRPCSQKAPKALFFESWVWLWQSEP